MTEPETATFSINRYALASTMNECEYRLARCARIAVMRSWLRTAREDASYDGETDEWLAGALESVRDMLRKPDVRIREHFERSVKSYVDHLRQQSDNMPSLFADAR